MNIRVIIFCVVIILVAVIMTSLEKYPEYKYEIRDLRSHLKPTTPKEYFNVDHIRPTKRKANKVISVSLFCKKGGESPGTFRLSKNGPIVELTEENMRTYNQSNSYSILDHTHTFWEYYVEPLINNSNYIVDHFTDWKLRVYLANDMPFVIPYLNPDTTEVYIMKDSSSAGVGMGTVWRFLVMDDTDVEVALITDSDKPLTKLVNFDQLSKHPKLNPDICMISIFEPYLEFSLFIACQMIVYPQRMDQYMDIKVRTLMEQYIESKIDPKLIYDRGFPKYGADETFLTTILFFEIEDKVCVVYNNLLDKSRFMKYNCQFIAI